MATLARQLGNLTFETPLIIGAGVVKTYAQARKALASDAGGVEIGSITPPPRAGNTGDNFYAHRERGVLLYTLNSLGMPNPGKDNVNGWARDAIHEAHDKNKRLGINVAADTPEEIVEMVEWSLECGFDWTTINAGCPNKYKKVGDLMVPESILSFSLDGTSELALLLMERIGQTDAEVWWKPSPDTNTLGTQIESFKIIAGCPTMTAAVLNNTFAHCFAYDADDKKRGVAIDAGGGLAGMGGPAVKPKALGDIKRLKTQHGDRFKWIGAGGVTYGVDIDDYDRVGAPVVQCTSAILAANEDYGVATTMLAEYCDHVGITF